MTIYCGWLLMLCHTRQLIKGSEKSCSKDNCVVLLFIWWNSIRTPIWSTLTTLRGRAGEPVLFPTGTRFKGECMHQGRAWGWGADFFFQFIFNWRIIALGQTFLHVEILDLFPSTHPSVSVFCRGIMLVTHQGEALQTERKSVNFGSQGQECPGNTWENRSN